MSLVPGRRQGQQSPPFSIPSLATQLGPNLELGLPFRTAVVSASEITALVSIEAIVVMVQCLLSLQLFVPEPVIEGTKYIIYTYLINQNLVKKCLTEACN